MHYPGFRILNGKLDTVKSSCLAQLWENLSDGASVSFWHPVSLNADLDVLAEANIQRLPGTAFILQPLQKQCVS